MKKETKELVNKDALLVLAVLHGDEPVGRQGTVEEQLCQAVNLCEQVRIMQMRYYAARTGRTFAGVNNSDRAETLLNRANKALHRAVRKILFLNTICRSLTGQYYVTEKIDCRDFGQCDQLADEFSSLQSYVLEKLAEEVKNGRY